MARLMLKTPATQLIRSQIRSERIHLLDPRTFLRSPFRRVTLASAARLDHSHRPERELVYREEAAPGGVLDEMARGVFRAACSAGRR